MTVANPTSTAAVCSGRDFSTSSDTASCRNVKRFDEDRSPKTITTPEDSTASWIDADEGCHAVDFLDEASRILYGEEDEDFVDVYHERFRSEYEQWKRIPHLRIVGKRIGQSSNEKAQEDRKQIVVDTPTRTSPNVLRDRVVEIMAEAIWQRLLSKTRDIENEHRKRRHMRQPAGWSGSERRCSSVQVQESALIVSPIWPTNRPSPQAFKSRTRLETINQSETAAATYNGPLRKSNTKYEKISWPKCNVDTLPPIDIYQKKPVDKSGKRWFSAVNAADRNHTPPRPVTSVTANVNNTGEDRRWRCDIILCFSRLSEMNDYRYSKTASALGNLVHVIRIFGVFTAIVMFGVGVDIATHHNSFGIYIMLMSLVVFFLEITWAITLFLNVCLKNEFNPIFSCWEIVLWLRLWKKSLLYTIFSLVFFLRPQGLWLSNVAGALLLWLSFLYMIITFKDCVQKRSDFIIIPKGQSASSSYDQYDDITDLLGDPIHVSLSADNLSELDQDGILEL